MKTLQLLTLTVAVALLSGCATGKNGLVLDTIGPSSSQPAAGDSTNGTLVVYSAYTRNADFASRDPRNPEYSDYRILSPDGTLLKVVHNDNGSILQGPLSVELPAGNYTVKARANGYGHLTIGVLIEPQQTTVLHLEGGSPWPNESVFNQTNAVRLPDGQIMGWRAAESPEAGR